TVDDPSGLDVARRLADLIEHDRAKKMLPCFHASIYAFGQAPDVVPERFPLIFPLPDVGSLIERHKVAPLLAENRPNTKYSGVHRNLPALASRIGCPASDLLFVTLARRSQCAWALLRRAWPPPRLPLPRAVPASLAPRSAQGCAQARYRGQRLAS